MSDEVSKDAALPYKFKVGDHVGMYDADGDLYGPEMRVIHLLTCAIDGMGVQKIGDYVETFWFDGYNIPYSRVLPAIILEKVEDE